MASYIWTCRQMSLLSRQWGSRPAGKRSGTYTTKCTRLPGSPLCGPEWTEELAGDVVSSFKNCLRWKGGQPPRELEESKLVDAQPFQSKTPRRRRRDASMERDLAKASKAHQRALAAMATLEERIEKLSWSITRGQPDAHAQSQSCDC